MQVLLISTWDLPSSHSIQQDLWLLSVCSFKRRRRANWVTCTSANESVVGCSEPVCVSIIKLGDIGPLCTLLSLLTSFDTVAWMSAVTLVRGEIPTPRSFKGRDCVTACIFVINLSYSNNRCSSKEKPHCLHGSQASKPQHSQRLISSW